MAGAKLVKEIKLERGVDGTYAPVERTRSGLGSRSPAVQRQEQRLYRLRPVKLGGITVDVAIDPRLVPVLTGLSTLGVVVGFLVQQQRGR